MRHKKLKANLIVILIVAAICFTSFSSISYADITFNTTPDSEELQRQKQYELPPVKAWFVDLKGNKRDAQSLHSIGLMALPDDEYYYIYDTYDLDHTSSDPKRFYVSDVRVENYSYSTITPIKYIQEEKVQTNWSVSSSILLEVEAGNDFIGKVKGATGVEVSSCYTSYSSTSIEYGPIDVPPRTLAKITKYRGGIDGDGALRYKVYSPNWTFLGYHYETGGGWTVSPSTTFTYTESSL